MFLVAALAGVYHYAASSLNYFEENSDLKAKYERRKNLDDLEKKMLAVEMKTRLGAQKRIPAAVSSSENGRDNLTTEAESAEPKLLAKQYFERAKDKCYELNSELVCLRIIEQAVSQYPESEWTGQSLVLLTDFYFRTKRLVQAREILKILKQDFKNYKSVQEKVIVIERHLT